MKMKMKMDLANFPFFRIPTIHRKFHTGLGITLSNALIRNHRELEHTGIGFEGLGIIIMIWDSETHSAGVPPPRTVSCLLYAFLFPADPIPQHATCYMLHAGYVTCPTCYMLHAGVAVTSHMCYMLHATCC
jgi:hypothetical protein